MPRRFAVALLFLLSFAAVPAFSQTVTFIDEQGRPVSWAVDYGRVRIRMVSALSDFTQMREESSITISSTLGLDTESMRIVETGERTATFEGEIDLFPGAPGDRAGVLDTVRDPAAYATNDTVRVTLSNGASATAEVFSSRVMLVDAYGNPATSYPLAGRVHARIYDKYYDTGALDPATATLTTSGGDQETLHAAETDVRTGIFEGSLPIGTGAPIPGNGIVETAAGETIEVRHNDLNGVTHSSATADVQPIAVQFVDAEGRPVSSYPEGSRVYLRVGGKPLDADPLLREAFPVVLYTQQTNDTEYFLLWETGLATGVYEGSVALSNVPGATNDGALQTGRTIVNGVTQFDTLEIDVFVDAGTFQAEAKTTGAIVRILDEWGQEGTYFPYRSKLKVRVEDPALPETTDILRTTQVTMRTPASSFDSEPLTLTETGFRTGTFEGEIQLGTGFATSDGILQTNQNERIEAHYADSNGQTTTIRKVFVVGSRVVFLDSSGKPCSTLFESATYKVRVFDFDQAGRGVPFCWAKALITGDEESVQQTAVTGQTGAFEGPLTPVIVASPQNDAKIRISSSFAAPDASDTVRVYKYFSGSGSPTASVIARTVRSRTRLLDDRGLDAVSYVPGAGVQVELENHVADATAAADTATVTVISTRTGDEETLVVTETGARTGIFRGLLPTTAFASSPGDGRLRITPGEAVGAFHAPADVNHRSGDMAPVVRRSVELVDAQGLPAAEFLIGGRVWVRAFDVDANADPGQPDTLEVRVYSTYGAGWELDVETLTLTETGPDTSLFTGWVQTSATEGSGALLQTYNGGPPASEYGGVEAYLADMRDTARLTDSALKFLNAQGAETTTLALLTQPRVRLERPRGNLDSAAVDTETVTVESLTTHDTLELTLTETGPNTGIFEAALPIATGAAAVDAVLQVQLGETVEARKYAGRYLASLARAKVVPRPNVAPVAANDSVTTNEDTAVTFAVLANDSDADGDTLTVTSVTGGAKGNTRVNADKTITYTPRADLNGADSFTYNISDGFGGTATAQVSVTITPVNDAPRPTGDAVTTNEDTPVTINVLANDVEPDGSPLTVVSTTQGTKGVAVINANGTVTYTPNLNATGFDTFNYTVSDGSLTAQGFVNVNILAINDRPVAVDDVYSVNEDGELIIAPLANDFDPDGPKPSLTPGSLFAQHGSVSSYIVPNQFVYRPSPNYNGPDTILYTITDGSLTDQGEVIITVNPVNDAPVANNDSVTTPEDVPATVNVLANDSDVDGNTLNVTAVTQGTRGAVVINPDKTVTYTPNLNISGTDSFTYTISDGTVTRTATVSVTITAVNDPPDAMNDVAAANEDAAVTITVLANDTDAENQTLTVTAVTQGAQGAVVINPDKTLRYTPNPNFNGVDAFTYTISDGNSTDTATVTVTVAPVNDVPVAAGDAAATNEDTAVSVAVLANDSDVDGDTLTISAVTQGVKGSVAINGAAVVYTPNPNLNGSDSFTYTISDGKGGTATATVTVTVAAVNDAPVAVADIVPTGEDTAAVIKVLLNDLDAEGNALTITAVTEPEHGAVTVNGAEITYIPDADYNGADLFTYEISDGQGATATGTVSLTITAVNDPPAATDDETSSDEDEAVTIAVLDNDSDVEEDPLTISEVTQGTNGTVDISGSSVVYTPNANFHGIDTFTYTVEDGNEGGTATAIVTVTITGINDPPVATNDSATTNEDAAVTVSVLGNDTDADGDSLSISVVTQGSNGSVAISGSSVVYTPNANFNGGDSFTYTVEDGNGGTSTGTVSVTVSGVNDTPAATNDSAATNEDTTVSVPVLGNDSDLDGDTLTISAVTQGSNGSVAISGSAVVYTPNANFNGSDSFTYTVSDGHGGTATASVAVTVSSVNDAPVAANDSAATNEDSVISVSVLGNDTDADGDSLTISAVTQGNNGSVAISGSAVVYTPNVNFNGSDVFTYTVSDGSGGSSTATVNVTVAGVNDVPVATNDSATTNEDAAVSISVLGNDSDLDGDSLVISAVTQGSNGSVAISGSAVVYTPNINFNGSDSFTYTVSDGNGGTATASVSVTVSGVNDVPVATNDSATTNEDAPVTVSVLGNDSDQDGDSLSISAVTQGSNGSVTLSGSAVVYTPNANFNGNDSFTYTVSDGNGGTVTASVSVTVSGVNDVPVAANDSATTNEDAAVSISVLGNDSDTDGDSLIISAVTQGNNGSVAISGSAVVYTPNVNFNGNDSFTYTVSDGNGGTATGAVSVTVSGVNDMPVAANDSAATNEDAAVSVSVLSNDSDIDGDSLAISAVTQGNNGSVAVSVSSVVYTPNANFNGNDTFTYTVSDGNGGTATGTVSVTVSGVNDAPVAAGDSATTNEDSAVTISVLGNDNDADGDSLTISAVTQGTNGSVTINSSAVIYTPNTNFNGSDSFTYTVSDGNGGTATATVSVTVSGVNDAPTAANDSATTNEDAAVTVSVLANDSDADGDSLTISAVTQGAHGSVAINGSAVVYTPNANFNGSDSFTYTVSDGHGGTATGTVSVTVSGINDAPDAVNDTATTAEDTAVNVAVLTNDSDPDGHALTVASVTQGTRGAVTINANGTVRYTPNANVNGSDSFTYTVSDGNGGTDTATVTITVTGVNDAPDAVNDAAATNEDTAVTISVLANDVDPDGEALTVTSVTQGTRGAVAINANGTVRYTPNANTNGPDSFTYTVRDGAGITDTATVTVNVAAVNDAPVATADAATTREGAAVNLNVKANDTDVENNALTVTAVSTPAKGTAAVNPDGTVTYTPAANFNGADTFTYTLSDGQGGTATGTVAITVKDALERVAVLATHGVWIQTGADVISGDVIVNQTGATPFLDGGSSELSLAGTVTTPAGWDVQANRLNIASGSTVASDAFFNQRTGAGSVTGALTSPLTLPVFATLPTFRTATPGTTDVNVGTNGTRTLAAGSYRDLIVGRKGVVTFTGGVYHFRTIQVDREAKLLFSAASDIRVQQKLSTLQTTIIGPAAGATIDGSDIVFFVAGVNGTGGGVAETPKTVEIGTDNVVQANVYAPNGTIWWKDRTQARGSSLGKDVQIGPDVQITLDSYWAGQ